MTVAMDQDEKHASAWPFIIVALTAFIIGMALGQLGAVRNPGHSRVSWPDTTVPHPRSLQP